jgi:hypothetical protein
MSRRFQEQPRYYSPHRPGRAVTKVRKDTNHTFHLLMTLVTVGMWGVLVWLPLTLWHRIGPRERYTTYYR